MWYWINESEPQKATNWVTNRQKVDEGYSSCFTGCQHGCPVHLHVCPSGHNSSAYQETKSWGKSDGTLVVLCPPTLERRPIGRGVSILLLLPAPSARQWCIFRFGTTPSTIRMVRGVSGLKKGCVLLWFWDTHQTITTTTRAQRPRPPTSIWAPWYPSKQSTHPRVLMQAPFVLGG